MKVLKFGAVWCPGCIVMKPRWAEIEKENPWLETEYFDFDENFEKVAQHQIGNTLPVFIFLDKEGNEILRKQGELSKAEILNILEEYKDR